MLRDIRLGVRMLMKQPGFTATAVLTLALGIGATAAVFSLIQGVLLTPPPYVRPDRLVLIPSARTDGRETSSARGWAAAQWLDWQKSATSLSAIGAYTWSFNFLVDADGSESLEGMAVTGDYFRVLGVQPMLGRAFLDSELTSPTAPVIVIGYDLWRRKFNGDPAIVGKTMRMSRRQTPPTIVGVMPPGVRFLPSPAAAQEPSYDVNGLVDFWTPAAPNPRALKQPFWDVVARLRDDATMADAQAELSVVVAREARDDRDFEGAIPRVVSLASELNRDGDRILLPLVGAAGLVLLIACGNVAALLLVRGLQRQQEYAMRTALGVSRAQLFRQVAVESLLLALAGGACGVALAAVIIKVFKLIGVHAIPRLDAVTAGPSVLASALALAAIAALLSGLLPAARASRVDPMQVLKSVGPQSSGGRRERRLLRTVTIAQIALTLALLVGAGLLIRTMTNLARVATGYDTDRVLTLTVTAVQGDWMGFHTRALERVAALPGVQHAAFAWGVPLTGNSWQGSVEVEGHPVTSAADRASIPLRAVTPGYFALIGQRIVDGRDFRDSDARNAPSVAIVNQAFADRYFPDGAAVGKKIWNGPRDRPSTDIVGVVANSRTADLSRAPEPEIYFSLWQASAFSKDLVIRTASDPRSIVSAVQREVRAVDPTAAVEHVRTLDEVRRGSLASRTFAMQLLVGFSIVGGVLTLVGVYGVVALSVAARRREIAIRTAVGARLRDIRGLFFAEGFKVIGAGIALGVGGALLLSRVLRSFLYAVDPTDPITLAAAAALFAAVALLACWVPTRRAAAVDPLEALRAE
jgi:putative ABC transport system permease protein